MRTHEPAFVTSKMHKDVTNIIDAALLKLNCLFQASTVDNAKVVQQSEVHDAMANLFIMSRLNSIYKKDYDEAKKRLDRACTELDINVEVVSGDGRIIFQNNIFAFTKNRNASSSTLSAKDLVIQLNKLGIDKAIIQEAIENASRPRMGNVYYSVTLNG